jgi:hypothetical protein
MKRTNVYVTDKQLERLHKRAEQEGVAMAELIRRAIDTFLAWDDPDYRPTALPPIRNGFHPPHE